jgi:hypothetical protein
MFSMYNNCITTYEKLPQLCLSSSAVPFSNCHDSMFDPVDVPA